MKTIVITGATSFLGLGVTERMIEDNKVYAVVRSTSANIKKLPSSHNLEKIYTDLQHLDRIKDVIKSADVFIHFAWDGSGNEGRANHEVQQKNVIYACNALKIAVELGCRTFLFPGSQAEYGLCNTVITEETICNPRSEYGIAKLDFLEKAKVFCSNIDIRYIHMRIFSVYGDNDRTGTLIDSCINYFNSGKELVLGPCAQRWNYLYIDDFAKAVCALIDSHCDSGIYNVAGNDTRILKSFVEAIYELSDHSGSYILGDNVSNPEGSPNLEPDISKIIRQTGWHPEIDFNRGIEYIMKKKIIRGIYTK